MDINDINTNCNLSIVIICRNEERNIASCIESVLKATEEIESREIILVNSASTDSTVEIAEKYPIKILQLKQSWHLSPAAGFYIGFLHTKGKYIQFQCGDTILDQNWFLNAIHVLEKNEQVAGVAGIVTQELYDTITAKRYAEYHKNLTFGEVTWFAGDSLFKRDALLKVGAFNPWLRALEEGELCYRMIEKGYKLLRLPHHMSHHLGCSKETYLSFIKKQMRYVIAQGQLLRYSLNSKRIFALLLKDYKFKLIGAIQIIFGILALSGAVWGYILLIYVWLTVFFAMFLWMLHETRNVKDALKLLVTNTLKSPFLVWGFFESKKDPDTYPTDVEVIKE
jgi:glycosyltransferase involved in cell wall biosynthesis